MRNNFLRLSVLVFILKLQLNKKDLIAVRRSSPERFLGEARTIRYKYDIIVRKKENYILSMSRLLPRVKRGFFVGAQAVEQRKTRKINAGWPP